MLVQNGFINPNPEADPYGASKKVYKLNANVTGAKTGLDIVMKVMSGDQFDIFVKSFHNSGNGNLPQTSILAATLLQGLLSASGGIATNASHATATTLEGIPSVSAAFSALQSDQQNQTSGSGLPQAGICWILFNDRFEVMKALLRRPYRWKMYSVPY